MANLSDDLANEFTRHHVDLLRVSDGIRDTVIEDLERLELELIRDLLDGVGKTEFTKARMMALLKQTQETIATAYDSIQEDVNGGLELVGKLMGQLTIDTVNASIGAELLSVALTPAQLEAIASDMVLFGKFPWEWWKDQDAKLRDRFARAMRDGQFRGEGIDKLVQRVRGTKEQNYTDGILEVPKAQAEALVRTSVLGVSNEARQQTIIANRDVIKGVQWISTLDNRTTEICMALDGLQWEFPEEGDAYEDYIPIGHDKAFSPPPAHWNCRSVTIPITYSFEELAGRHGNTKAAKAADAISEGKRASIDGQVAGSTTFEDWLGKQSDAQQDEILGPTVAKLWREGRIDVRDLTDARNTPLTVAQLVAKYGEPEG